MFNFTEEIWSGMHPDNFREDVRCYCGDYSELGGPLPEHLTGQHNEVYAEAKREQADLYLDMEREDA